MPARLGKVSRESGCDARGESHPGKVGKCRTPGPPHEPHPDRECHGITMMLVRCTAFSMLTRISAPGDSITGAIS